METNFSEIDPTRILKTGLFDFEEAEESAGWIEELNKEEHTPDGGIWDWFVRLQDKLPFDPERFWHFFHAVSIQHHPKQGAVLDRLAPQPGLDLGSSGRVDSHRQRRVVVEQHAFLLEDAISVFRREPNGHRKDVGPPIRRSEN